MVSPREEGFFQLFGKAAAAEIKIPKAGGTLGTP